MRTRFVLVQRLPIFHRTMWYISKVRVFKSLRLNISMVLLLQIFHLLLREYICALLRVWVLLTSSTISLNPKLIYMIMATRTFHYNNHYCVHLPTHPATLSPNREQLIHHNFYTNLSWPCKTLNTPTSGRFPTCYL